MKIISSSCCKYLRFEVILGSELLLRLAVFHLRAQVVRERRAMFIKEQEEGSETKSDVLIVPNISDDFKSAG